MGERAKLRRLAGLTQAELALRVGMHAPRICLWERGLVEIKQEQAQRIATILREGVALWLKQFLAGGRDHAIFD
jgi:transcriptional regulator with XRE-family HTH domain